VEICPPKITFQIEKKISTEQIITALLQELVEEVAFNLTKLDQHDLRDSFLTFKLSEEIFGI
jgi:hypothetical protein